MEKNCEPAMNGVAITTSSDVVKFAQTSSGIRQNVMPGARMVMIVTRKLSAVMIDDAPAHWTPMLKKIVPSGWCTDSGAYPVQPAANAPPGTMKEQSIMIPAIGSNQYDSAFKRGNAMSGAPSINGTTKFAIPAKAGITNRKIISAACTLKSPLYVWLSKNCIPGLASSDRTISASKPAARKKKIVVVRYWIPITL